MHWLAHVGQYEKVKTKLVDPLLACSKCDVAWRRTECSLCWCCGEPADSTRGVVMGQVLP